MNALLLFIFTLLLNPGVSSERSVSPAYLVYDEKESFIKAVKILNVEEVVVDLCAIRPDLCQYAVRAYNKTRKHFKESLIRIAAHESMNFKYTRGVHDKDDLCFAQVNRRVWYNVLPALFRNRYGVWKSLENNEPYACARAEAFIWLYNMSVFYKQNGYLPKNVHIREALYHSTTIRWYYVKKLKRIKEVQF